MRCQNCGHENNSNAKFCVGCGKPLNVETNSAPQNNINSNNAYNMPNYNKTPYNQYPNSYERQGSWKPIHTVVIVVIAIIVVTIIILAVLFTTNSTKIAIAQREAVSANSNNSQQGNDKQNNTEQNNTEQNNNAESNNSDATTDNLDGDEEYSDEFIIPYSDSEYISKDDAAALDDEQLRMAINELYARHGAIFKKPEVRSYFESFSWYYPRQSQAQAEQEFNKYEKANLKVLTQERSYRK